MHPETALRTVRSSIIVTILLLPGLLFAIAYGVPDCDINGNNCGHPNVVFISGFDASGNTVPGSRCTGILISTDSFKYVFLTAAHCSRVWIEDANIDHLGVTFDGMVIRPIPNDPNFNDQQFVLGGIPIEHPDFKDAAIPKNDLGAILFALNATDPFGQTIAQKWPGRPPALLIQDSNVDSIDELVAGFSHPTHDFVMTSAGYGFTEFLDFPGNNRGGINANALSLGSLRFAGHQTFRNLRSTILMTSSNPALGNNGPCNGDSGGPNYFFDNGIETVLGVTSSGDPICRSFNTIARIDIPEATQFINCVRDTNKSITQAKLCGPSTNRFDP